MSDVQALLDHHVDRWMTETLMPLMRVLPNKQFLVAVRVGLQYRKSGPFTAIDVDEVAALARCSKRTVQRTIKALNGYGAIDRLNRPPEWRN
jgi:hypothetical protein